MMCYLTDVCDSVLLLVINHDVLLDVCDSVLLLVINHDVLLDVCDSVSTSTFDQ